MQVCVILVHTWTLNSNGELFFVLFFQMAELQVSNLLASTNVSVLHSSSPQMINQWGPNEISTLD